MSRISQIDKNFEIKAPSTRQDTVFINATDPAFEINGVYYEDGKFRRLPEEVAKEVSWGVLGLSTNTAGGRLRFKTNSSYIILHATLGEIGKMPHFALTGSAGFDLYQKEEEGYTYRGTIVPAFDVTDTVSGIVDFGTNELREITIDFPLYSEVCELHIGLQNTATIEKPTPYKNEKPVVFYGSSITQGGCASKAGTSYEGFLSRWLDIDYINLGFSGNAKAEDAMIDYIKNLDMSVFVYDYDHNAPSVEHLRATHEKMFKAVREQNPTLPIIMMSRPKVNLSSEEKQRLEIITATYQKALAAGDKNVYLIIGPQLLAISGDDGTVDGCHPTDLGFYSMAKALCGLLKELL